MRVAWDIFPHHFNLLQPMSAKSLPMALGGALLFLAACGGGGSPPAADTGTLALAQPGELLALARLRLVDAAQPLPTPAPALTLASDATGSSTVLRSATVVQEAGVDEADLIKSSATHVYTLDDRSGVPRVRSHRLLADGSTVPQASLALPHDAGTSPALQGMLLAPAAQRLAVLGEAVRYLPVLDPCAGIANCASTFPRFLPTSSEIQLHLLRSPAAGGLALEHTLTFTGRLVGSRLVGMQLVLVSTHTPVVGGNTAGERSQALARLTTADLLPPWRLDNQPAQPLVNDTDCYLQTAALDPTPGLQLTTVTVLDLAAPVPTPRSRCYVGAAEAMYLSPLNLYLATTRAQMQTTGGVLRYTGTLATDLHKFNLTTLAWRGSGQVAGHLGWDASRKPYRLSEQGEHLRVLSFTGDVGWLSLDDAAQRAASPATLTVLREAGDGRRLVTVATLPNAQRQAPLGRPGEQVHGVRFVGDRGYVVTFRRTDPLYVLDLANPADPQVAGALEVPGFAEHLFPLANGLLFGAGHDADASGQVLGLCWTLFDVADPAQPRALHTELTGGRFSASTLTYTPHGLALRVDGAQVRLAVPVWLADAGVAPGSPGVLRLAVNTQDRSLVAKPVLPVPAMQPEGLWSQRLMHSGERLLHLVGGELLPHAW
jgi:hypothetical protein